MPVFGSEWDTLYYLKMCPIQDSRSLVLPRLYFTYEVWSLSVLSTVFLSVDEVPAQMHVHYDVTLKL